MKALELTNALVALYGNSSILSNMKLNKLAYFAYASNLRRGYKLFDDEIQAWQYGPVIPSIYHAYSRYGSAGVHALTQPVESISKEAFIAAHNVWKEYGFMTAIDLMKYSHKPDGAWKHVFNANKNCMRISDNDILASADGQKPPSKEGTFSQALDNASARWDNVLKMLSCN